jgi:hypothetical protein
MKGTTTIKLILISLVILVFLMALFQGHQWDQPYQNSSIDFQSPLLLGSNLGVWADDDYWGVDESFVKYKKQRELATNVISTFRFSCRYISDDGLLTVVDKIEQVKSIPFVVLPANDDSRSEYVVKLLGERVNWYEYGNEVGWWLGMSAEEHAKRFCAAYPKLKKINPDIKLGGPAQGSPDAEEYKRWANSLRQNCPQIKPDFISFHKYWAYTTESNREIIQSVSDFGEEIETIRDITTEIFGEDLPLIVSEWNWHSVPENYRDNRDMDKEFIKEFTTSVLDQMDKHDVFMAHQYCYGSGCGDGHLDMVTSYGPKHQYQVFLEYSKIINTNTTGKIRD